MGVTSTATDDYLRCCIISCTAVGMSSVPRTIDELFGEAEIDQLDVTVFVKQDILRLKVPIDYVLLVKLLKSYENFSKVED